MSSKSEIPMEDEAAESSPSLKPGTGVSKEQCEDMIAKGLRNPVAKFLMESLESAGCNMPPNFFKAVDCDKHISGGYLRGEGIVVCSNHMTFQDEVNQVIIHELIHAYDDCRAKVDWSNCAHHACSEKSGKISSGTKTTNKSLPKSESMRKRSINVVGHLITRLTFQIRAAHLSGDCHFKRELFRGFMSVRGHEKECVKRRVLKSVSANPHCSRRAGKLAMDAVFDVCYNDTKPFDKAI